MIYATAIALSIFQGWLFTDDEGILSPVLNWLRARLGKKSRRFESTNDDERFNWWHWIGHKFNCRVCSGLEAPLAYVVLEAGQGFWHGVGVLVTALVAHLAYNETIEALKGQ